MTQSLKPTYKVLLIFFLYIRVDLILFVVRLNNFKINRSFYLIKFLVRFNLLSISNILVSNIIPRFKRNNKKKYNLLITSLYFFLKNREIDFLVAEKFSEFVDLELSSLPTFEMIFISSLLERMGYFELSYELDNKLKLNLQDKKFLDYSDVITLIRFIMYDNQSNLDSLIEANPILVRSKLVSRLISLIYKNNFTYSDRNKSFILGPLIDYSKSYFNTRDNYYILKPNLEKMSHLDPKIYNITFCYGGLYDLLGFGDFIKYKGYIFHFDGNPLLRQVFFLMRWIRIHLIVKKKTHGNYIDQYAVYRGTLFHTQRIIMYIFSKVGLKGEVIIKGLDFYSGEKLYNKDYFNYDDNSDFRTNLSKWSKDNYYNFLINSANHGLISNFILTKNLIESGLIQADGEARNILASTTIEYCRLLQKRFQYPLITEG